MAKGTIITLFILAIGAFFLMGINVGKKIGNPASENNKQITDNKITPTAIPTITPSPVVKTEASPSSTIKQNTNEISSYTDKKCGFSLSFPTSYLSQKSENGESVILTDPNDPNKMLAFVCGQTIPRPEVTADKIASIILNGQPATIYHDKDTNGNPREVLIVKHPGNGMEIILAGTGEIFQQALDTFKFL